MTTFIETTLQKLSKSSFPIIDKALGGGIPQTTMALRNAMHSRCIKLTGEIEDALIEMEKEEKNSSPFVYWKVNKIFFCYYAKQLYSESCEKPKELEVIYQALYNRNRRTPANAA